MVNRLFLAPHFFNSVALLFWVVIFGSKELIMITNFWGKCQICEVFFRVRMMELYIASPQSSIYWFVNRKNLVYLLSDCFRLSAQNSRAFTLSILLNAECLYSLFASFLVTYNFLTQFQIEITVYQLLILIHSLLLLLPSRCSCMEVRLFLGRMKGEKSYFSWAVRWSNYVFQTSKPKSLHFFLQYS